MPKTRDAFAFQIILDGLELEARAKKFRRQGNSELATELEFQAWNLHSAPFRHKDGRKPFQSDRIKELELERENCSKDLRRTFFLLNRLDVHDRRLKAVLSKHDSDSEIGRRARILAEKYKVIRDCACGYVDLMKELIKYHDNVNRFAFNEELGVRLRLSRKKKKYTQDDVAEILGVTRNAYSNYEKGRREIPPLFIYRLANLLDVSTEYLLGTEKKTTAETEPPF